MVQRTLIFFTTIVLVVLFSTELYARNDISDIVQFDVLGSKQSTKMLDSYAYVTKESPCLQFSTSKKAAPICLKKKEHYIQQIMLSNENIYFLVMGDNGPIDCSTKLTSDTGAYCQDNNIGQVVKPNTLFTRTDIKKNAIPPSAKFLGVEINDIEELTSNYYDSKKKVSLVAYILKTEPYIYVVKDGVTKKYSVFGDDDLVDYYPQGGVAGGLRIKGTELDFSIMGFRQYIDCKLDMVTEKSACVVE